MEIFSIFKRHENKVDNEVIEKEIPSSNPTVAYDDIKNTVNQILELESALEKEVKQLLDTIEADAKLANVFDIDAERKFWNECFFEESSIFFEPDLNELDDDQYDYFIETYIPIIEHIEKELSDITKLKKRVDEYQIFKISLFNVFNNYNNLPFKDYINQICERSVKNNMKVYVTDENSLDLFVEYKPLDEINRDSCFYEYKFNLFLNPNYQQEDFMYKLSGIDVFSYDSFGNWLESFPLYNDFKKFNFETDLYFSNNTDSLFHIEARKRMRMFEKKKFHIPND